MKYWLVVPAAGLGARFASALPKQYSLLFGRPVIEHCLERLLGMACEAIVVAVHAQDSIWKTLDIARHERIRSVVGGNERADSVFSALRAIAAEADDQDWVLVHDVVRPCITATDLQRLTSGLADSPVGGLLATPVSATLKRVATAEAQPPASWAEGSEGLVSETVDRKGLWLAATPQMFRYGLLTAAIKTCLDQGTIITDEAAAMEFAGHQAEIVRGRTDNIKITYAEDLALAEAILQTQSAALHQAHGLAS